jgi:hypothetical protein
VAEKRRLPDVVGEAIAIGRSPDTDTRFVDSYLAAMDLNLTEKHIKALLLLCWLEYVSVRRKWRRSQYRWEREWLRENVLPAAPWLQELVVTSAKK